MQQQPTAFISDKGLELRYNTSRKLGGSLEEYHRSDLQAGHYCL